MIVPASRPGCRYEAGQHPGRAPTACALTDPSPPLRGPRQAPPHFAAGKGSSQNSVVQAALVKYLDDANDGTLIIRRLDRLSRAVGRVHRDVTVLADALAVYVQVWLAHTPRIADGDRPAAERVALARFAQFTEHVAARVASGKSVMTDLARGADGPEDDDPTDATNEKEGA